mgnify:CR=1 FL=1
MKSLAIISEYNPCHKGHAYQIEKARELSGSDIIIALMSGNFVQRGIPAVFDKYTRAGLKIKEEKRFILFPYYCRSCFRFIVMLLFFRQVNLICISNRH